MGSPGIAVPSLVALHREFGVGLVVTQPDRPSGRGRAESTPAVKRAAVELGIPVHQPGRLRTEESLRPLKTLAPDFIVVLAYGEMLSREVLGLPRVAPVNAHMSLLPRHRGPSPVSAAILAGDSETGVTTMRITRKMDEGPVYLVDRVAISSSDNAETLASRLAPAAAALLVKTVHGILDGTLKETPQGDEATYCRLIGKSDGRIDWTAGADRIERMT
ncbi:MAG: methionyl-tRNA formyltransferase, partial [Planctomycetes bacterium]|nr:methionyl-tRNA formyltransferase [Planctomycetota bacterium]